jgi:transcriptional regulator with XRE-family HTH domain
MNADPLDRLLAAFGEMIIRRRHEQKMAVEELAVATGLSKDEIENIERGWGATTIVDFFRIASALGEDPILLFVDLVAARRVNPTDLGLYKSRASDFARLYRLGYHHDVGDFRELPAIYGTESLAVTAAAGLNVRRKAKGQPRVDALLTYARLAWAPIRLEGGAA